MKITKSQLRRIIKEERAKLAEISDEQAARINAEQSSLQMQGMGIFNANHIYDLFYDELALVQPTATTVSPEAFDMFEEAVNKAVQQLRNDLT